MQQVDLRFPREGIDYDSLSDEEKELWEETDRENGQPDRVNAVPSTTGSIKHSRQSAEALMEHGNKVEGGDR